MKERDSVRSSSLHGILPIPQRRSRQSRREFRRDPAQHRPPVTDRFVHSRAGYFSATERSWLEQDLERAAEFQRQLLPEEHVQFEGWEISYCYQPLGPLGGDYCDIIICGSPEKELLLLVGDACGKGVAASLLMAELHAIFRSLGSANLPIQELVERANRILCQRSLSSSYATLVCVRAKGAGDVEICNAGHCSPLLVRQTGIARIEAGGIPLGLFPNSHCDATRMHLAKGESLFLYTDGLTEARDHNDLEYGTERLLQSVQNSSALPAPAMIATSMQSVANFQAGIPSSDDVTVMAIRYS